MSGLVSTRAGAIAAATIARIPKLCAPDAKAAKRFLEYFAESRGLRITNRRDDQVSLDEVERNLI